MNFEFTHCIFIAGEKDRIEKPGVVTISGGTIRVDDFVVVCGESTVNELILKFVQDRISLLTQ